MFVRAKFISEGFHSRKPGSELHLKAEEKSGRICNPGSHLYSAPIPGGHNVFSYKPFQTQRMTNNKFLARPGDIEKELRLPWCSRIG